jgi:cyclophilin family peptidyl-prolyl cis-trans isomerase
MRHLSIFLASLLLAIQSYSQSIDSTQTERVVSIQTSFGEIQAKLYNETPQHRDNFIQLIEDGFYDSLLFHRVIYGFMIQGGDPDSRNAKPNQKLGNGKLDYEVPAEFVDTIIHKHGVLAAAREPDNINPTKASSACQFYLVQGRVMNNEQLDQLEQRIRQTAYQQKSNELFKLPENDSLKKATAQAYRSNDSLRIATVKQALDSLVLPQIEEVSFNEQQRQTYSSVGGTPHLDGSYTVFGEMISGFNVLDSIASATTDRNDRPVEDIVFSIQLLK